MRYVGQRVTRFLIVFFIVTFTVMVLLRLGLNSPGDPARTMLGGYPDQALIDADQRQVPPAQQLPGAVLPLAPAGDRRA